MPTSIRVLIIEDTEPDARLMVRELRRADYDPTWERVETSEAMRAALERQAWDVVLSDYKMPHFSGPAALRLLQAMELDLPFIVVSGTIGEENAVAMMKAGAHDYILKEKLARLAPAIAREMREVEVRRARRQAETELQTTIRSLQENEEKYRTLFNVEPDALLLIEMHTMQILDANEAAVRLYGYAHEYLLTMKATDLSAEPEQTRATVQETASDQMIRVPFRYNRKADGTVFPVEAAARIFTLNERQVMFAALRDITDRLRAEDEIKRERAYLASAIELLPFPIVFIDQEQQMFRANRASERIFPTGDRAPWFNVPILSPETHVEIPLEQRPAARALRGEVVTAFEGILRTPSDQELPVLIYASPITVGSDLVAAVIAIQDITVVKEADRAKNQFINVISHEMRTPLTAILGWAQVAESDPALCADALHAIHQSAQAQHAMLERLILLSRILTGKLTLQRQPADLWELADQVVTASQRCAQERRIMLRCHPPTEPLPVSVDAKLMRQALQEMLDNALKYTAAGGQITVSVMRLEGQAVVAVHDTGQGIALEDLPKLWKPFQQVIREERLGGLGIGLVNLRSIVETHGGQVFIVSPGVGKGSTFSISIALVLPLSGPPDPGAKEDCG